MAVNQATRLGCGRDVDDVWDHIDQPPDEHEQACPYCTKARSDLAELAAATRQLAAADRKDSTLRVPDGMLSDVLTIARTEVRRGRTIPLQRRVPARHHSAGDQDDSDHDGDISGGDPASDLAVSEQLIATVVREVCDRNPDVEVRRVRIDATTTPTAAADAAVIPPTGGAPRAIEPADLYVELQAAVRPNVAIPGLLDDLRRTIQSAVVSRIGTTVSRIDIDVVDLIDV